MTECFETLLGLHYRALERYVFYKIPMRTDAQDVLQEIILAAFVGFDRLTRAQTDFRPWIFGIAAHKLADYFRAKAASLEIPLAALTDTAADPHGQEEALSVREALARMPDRERQILYLFYIKGYRQREIAALLGIPVGTVKSRVHSARHSFAMIYPSHRKGETIMQTLQYPGTKPQVAIEPDSRAPFAIALEEIPGWFIVPKIGQKGSWAFYDDPDGRWTGTMEMDCPREAVIHGIPCIQVDIKEHFKDKVGQRTIFVRLTDTHCTYIAEAVMREGIYHFASFVDEEWLARYQVGENNEGRSIHIQANGNARWSGDHALTVSREETPDIVGRYRVTVAGKAFDTVAVTELTDGILTFEYVDTNGRTVCFCRYNHDDWKLERYKKPWTQALPESERLLVNGDTYVHWYDCITGYALGKA